MSAAGATAQTNGADSAGAPNRASVVSQMIAQIGRDSLFYGIATTSVFPLALLQTGILTRFLAPSAYGRMAILFFFAAMMTVVLNLFVLRGVERRVWASTDDGLDLEDERPIEASMRPTTLGTGLIMTIVLSVTGFIGVYLFAGPLAHALVGRTSLRTAMIWTGASGALGAIWRLVANIARWERRRSVFLVVYVARPLLAVFVAWPLLIAGYGLAGVLAGTAIGTAVAIVFGLIASRKSYKLRLNRSAVLEIIKADLPMVAMIAGLSVLHDADTYVLAQVHSQAQVGLFRIASRMTSIVSYGVSAFTLAWAPLEASSLFRAAYERHGHRELRSGYITYYLILGTFMILVLSVTARPVVAVIAPHFGKAVPLVPATGIGFLFYGLLIVIARTSEFPRRYLIYGIAAISGAGVLIFTGLELGGPLGAYGVVLGDVAGALAGILVVVIAAFVGGTRPLVNVPKVVAVILIGGACYALGVPVAEHTGVFDVPLKALSLPLFPVLLILSGTVGRRERRALWGAIRMGPRQRAARQELIGATARLPQHQQRLLLAATRDHNTLPRLERLTGLREHAVKSELVRSLRVLTEMGRPGRWDSGIGDLLLSEESVTERDSLSKGLMDNGVKPTELHTISSAFKALKSAPPKSWSSVLLNPLARLPAAPWDLDHETIELLGAIIREGQPYELLAGSNGARNGGVDHTLIGALRHLAGIGGDPRTDRLICTFLFGSGERPAATQLWAAGVDPLELHELELRAGAIRELPEKEWQEIAGEERENGGRRLLPAGAPS